MLRFILSLFSHSILLSFLTLLSSSILFLVPSSSSTGAVQCGLFTFTFPYPSGPNAEHRSSNSSSLYLLTPSFIFIFIFYLSDLEFERKPQPYPISGLSLRLHTKLDDTKRRQKSDKRRTLRDTGLEPDIDLVIPRETERQRHAGSLSNDDTRATTNIRPHNHSMNRE